MPFPIAHALLGASVVVAGSPQPIQANGTDLRKLLLGSFLGILPDFDYFGIWFLDLDKTWHRGFSHSLLMAIVAGALFSLSLRTSSRLRWSMICSAAMASHGLLDGLVSMNRGAALLWPLTSHRFAAGLLEYPDILSVQYHTSADMLVVRGFVRLLEYSAIELVVMSALLILTFFVKSKFESRSP